MDTTRDVIRVWCDRLDSWLLSKEAVAIAPKRPGSIPPKRPGHVPPKRPGHVPPKRPGHVPPKRPELNVLGRVDVGATSHVPDRFMIELDNDATKLILRSGCSFTMLVSSRWGRDPQHHWKFGQLLMRGASEARRQGTVLLVADGSAVEPWAQRAANLTGATLLRVGFGEQACQSRPQLWVRHSGDAAIQRDEAIIMMADHIDALHVRRGGRIEACLKKRLEPVPQFSESRCAVRVGVTTLPNSTTSAATNLIKAGAVGWVVTRATNRRDSVDDQKQHLGTHQNEAGNKPVSAASNAPELCTTRHWLNEPEQWLVHCTRAPQGPWPGETLAEYRDSILTHDCRIADRTAFDALCRIIQSGELVSSAIVSSRQYPVVCWSAVPLLELLQRRCFRSHVQRWDYEPYGVAVRVKAIRDLGGRPVIYGQAGEADQLPVSERFRHQAVGRSNDWRQEKEWRLAGSLALISLNPRHVRIFTLDSCLARSRLVNLPWKVTILKQRSKRTLKKTGNDGLSEIWKAV